MYVAIYVQLSKRRKPLKWCKTTGAEHGGSLAGFLPKEKSFEWTLGSDTMEGQIFGKSQERKSDRKNYRAADVEVSEKAASRKEGGVVDSIEPIYHSVECP